MSWPEALLSSVIVICIAGPLLPSLSEDEMSVWNRRPRFTPAQKAINWVGVLSMALIGMGIFSADGNILPGIIFGLMVSACSCIVTTAINKRYSQQLDARRAEDIKRQFSILTELDEIMKREREHTDPHRTGA